MTRSDADLVRRVLAGERDDFAELVRRHQDVLYRHARGMGLDHDTSLDLVQDAFVKAYARLNECRDPARFRAWLFSIARRLCLDHLKNVRRATVPFSSVPDVVSIPAADHADAELNRALAKALDALPVATREAFLLKHDAEYTYEDIAIMTEASVSAVKMRVHRAREALRSHLEQQGIHAA